MRVQSRGDKTRNQIVNTKYFWTRRENEVRQNEESSRQNEMRRDETKQNETRGDEITRAKKGRLEESSRDEIR